MIFDCLNRDIFIWTGRNQCRSDGLRMSWTETKDLLRSIEMRSDRWPIGFQGNVTLNISLHSPLRSDLFLRLSNGTNCSTMLISSGIQRILPPSPVIVVTLLDIFIENIWTKFFALIDHRWQIHCGSLFDSRTRVFIDNQPAMTRISPSCSSSLVNEKIPQPNPKKIEPRGKERRSFCSSLNIKPSLLFPSQLWSLASLNSLRLWPGNSADERWASYFVHCLIIKDFQRGDLFYFVAQRGFAVEKDDGKVTEKRKFSLEWIDRTRLTSAERWREKTMEICLHEQIEIEVLCRSPMLLDLLLFEIETLNTDAMLDLFLLLLLLLSAVQHILSSDLSTKEASTAFQISLAPLSFEEESLHRHLSFKQKSSSLLQTLTGVRLRLNCQCRSSSKISIFSIINEEKCSKGMLAISLSAPFLIKATSISFSQPVKVKSSPFVFLSLSQRWFLCFRSSVSPSGSPCLVVIAIKIDQWTFSGRMKFSEEQKIYIE